MSIARCSKTARAAGVAAWRARGKGNAEGGSGATTRTYHRAPLRRQEAIGKSCRHLLYSTQ